MSSVTSNITLTFHNIQCDVRYHEVVPLGLIANDLAFPVAQLDLGEARTQVHQRYGDDVRLPLQAQVRAQTGDVTDKILHCYLYNNIIAHKNCAVNGRTERTECGSNTRVSLNTDLSFTNVHVV